MAGTDRTAQPAVELLRELQQNGPKYDFFQALRYVERAFPDKPRLGRTTRAGDDPIRLSQEPSLAFAPSTIADVQPTRSGGWEMSVRFFGLFGPNGPLPLHLTEYARERERNHHDQTLSRFLDIFHHRMLSLFYRAWADAQPQVQFERPSADRFATYVSSLFGCGMPELRDRDDMPDLAKLHYAGHLSSQTRHAEGLRSVLADFFQLPVEIEEFVGQWTELPEDCRCHLGGLGSPAKLGQASTIGSHVWDCQQKFRIRIGPMKWNDYERLLPGGAGLRRLVAVVRNYVGDELMWDLNLILRAAEVPPARLAECGQLGRSSWLAPAGIGRDMDDIILAASDAVAASEPSPTPSATEFADESEYSDLGESCQSTNASYAFLNYPLADPSIYSGDTIP